MFNEHYTYQCVVAFKGDAIPVCVLGDKLRYRFYSSFGHAVEFHNVRIAKQCMKRIRVCLLGCSYYKAFSFKMFHMRVQYLNLNIT